MQTIKDAISQILKSLTPLVGDNEARSFVWLMFDYLRGYSRVDLILKEQEALNAEEKEFLNQALLRLIGGEPIQYVLGKTEFLGFTFKVDKRVLIPRPETEELVEWIVSETHDSHCRILDIGTGSGCIAVTLKKLIPRAEVESWDVSEGALQLAAENAGLNKAEVSFRHRDVLLYQPSGEAVFDVVVSNPPYVRESEKAEMAINVLDHEPSLALFVPDQDPLRFYRAIAQISKKLLKKGGRLYFEINRSYGKEMEQLLLSEGFVEVVLRCDLSGNDRMIRAIWPGGR